MDDLVQEAAKEGGKIVPVFCDHTNNDDVKALFGQIEREQNGRLDLLVNNAVANVMVSFLEVIWGFGRVWKNTDRNNGFWNLKD